MQSVLVNPLITKEKILSSRFLSEIEDIKEFIVYSDNILEGITLLNDITVDDRFLGFAGVVYEPISQPVYVFVDNKERYYAIKICGSYEKWRLPKEVKQIINYIDLPDYIIYSVKNKKVILAGENTETASVGNSQWQREGRKLGAAKIGVPFIYQTFYSGRDESQDTIREPSSLQVYNHLIYSVRYKTPSFVCYLENNFDKSSTRNREESNGKSLLCDYIKATLLFDVDCSVLDAKIELEKSFYKHMISYIKEIKYSDIGKTKETVCRLMKDFPSLKKELLEELINNSDEFIDKLVEYLYEKDSNLSEKYLTNSLLLDFDKSLFEKWTSYNSKNHIKSIIDSLQSCGKAPISYIKGSAKVGFADTYLCKQFLSEKFCSRKEDIEQVLNPEKYEHCILMPLRIHKVSNGKKVFSPDPESGEIVAFSELFSLDIKGNKKMPVIGYCIVDTPDDFKIEDKAGTKLYKALSEYVDLIILNDSEIYTKLPWKKEFDDYFPLSLNEVIPISTTEEMAVVSIYLNQSTINAEWKLCFIHTHHSSWQQMVIFKEEKEIQQKIDRVSTKVDLIMQDKDLFMIAEGKNDYLDIIKDSKIKRAMCLASEKIDDLFGRANKKFDAFIYNLNTVPKKEPEFYVARESETVKQAIEKGHFADIAYNSFVVIIVYLTEKSTTGFKLIYSPDFDAELKKQLEKEFNQ